LQHSVKDISSFESSQNIYKLLYLFYPVKFDSVIFASQINFWVNTLGSYVFWVSYDTVFYLEILCVHGFTKIAYPEIHYRIL